MTAKIAAAGCGDKMREIIERVVGLSENSGLWKWTDGVAYVAVHDLRRAHGYGAILEDAASSHPPAMGGEGIGPCYCCEDRGCDEGCRCHPVNAQVASAPTCACRGGLSNPAIVHGATSCAVASGPSEPISPVTFIGGVLNEPDRPTEAELRSGLEAARRFVQHAGYKALASKVASEGDCDCIPGEYACQQHDPVKRAFASEGDAGVDMCKHGRPTMETCQRCYAEASTPNATVEELAGIIKPILERRLGASGALAREVARAVGARTTRSLPPQCFKMGPRTFSCCLIAGHGGTHVALDHRSVLDVWRDDGSVDDLLPAKAPPTFGEGAREAAIFLLDKLSWMEKLMLDSPTRSVSREVWEFGNLDAAIRKLQAAVDAEFSNGK